MYHRATEVPFLNGMDDMATDESRCNGLQAGNALPITNVKSDFQADGSLDRDTVVPILNDYVDAYVNASLPVYSRRSCHPNDHVSFTMVGGPWLPQPVLWTDSNRRQS